MRQFCILPNVGYKNSDRLFPHLITKTFVMHVDDSIIGDRRATIYTEVYLSSILTSLHCEKYLIKRQCYSKS